MTPILRSAAPHSDLEGRVMSDERLISELERLVSEDRNPRSMDIDLLPTIDVLREINEEDQGVPAAVEKVIPQIAEAVEEIVRAFQKGAAGWSISVQAPAAASAVLDASECPPTFSVPEGMVVGLIAGGSHALQHAVEGAEDSPEQGQAGSCRHRADRRRRRCRHRR
jgi:N-acetylmuramic acid 6-phosphate etherase